MTQRRAVWSMRWSRRASCCIRRSVAFRSSGSPIRASWALAAGARDRRRQPRVPAPPRGSAEDRRARLRQGRAGGGRGVAAVAVVTRWQYFDARVARQDAVRSAGLRSRTAATPSSSGSSRKTAGKKPKSSALSPANGRETPTSGTGSPANGRKRRTRSVRLPRAAAGKPKSSAIRLSSHSRGSWPSWRTERSGRATT